MVLCWSGRLKFFSDVCVCVCACVRVCGLLTFGDMSTPGQNVFRIEKVVFKVMLKMHVYMQVCVYVCVRACIGVCVWMGQRGVLIFGDILTHGQNVFKTKRRIIISIGFSTLLISVIVKACTRYFSLFLKSKCISLLFRTKYIEKKFNLAVFSSHCFTNIYSLQGYHALPASSKLLVLKK